MHHHKYSISELEDMLPWERQVYIAQLEKFIYDENERLRKLNQ